MKKILVVMGVAILPMLLCGCPLILVGGGVAGGIAISKDSVTLNADTSFERAWNVTYGNLKNMGAIIFEDKKNGKIEAEIQDTDVYAQITRLTKKTMSIQIKARKNMLPNIDLAQNIINKINSAL